jgi:hypothetical protein
MTDTQIDRSGAGQPALSSLARSFMLYAVFLGVAASCIAILVSQLVQVSLRPAAQLLALGDAKTSAVSVTATTTRVLEGDSWLQDIKTKWQGKASASARSESSGNGAGVLGNRSSLGGGQTPTFTPSGTTTHRTVCVRTCDGYFFPISFAASEDHFERDQQTCARSCASPAKLYVYRNPGQEPEQMVDLEGRPYTKSPTAFQFRTTFDQSCKCAPHPWEQEAIARHRAYADADNKTRSNRQASKSARGSERSEGRALDKPMKSVAATTVDIQQIAASPGTGIIRLSAMPAASNAPTRSSPLDPPAPAVATDISANVDPTTAAAVSTRPPALRKKSSTAVAQTKGAPLARAGEPLMRLGAQQSAIRTTSSSFSGSSDWKAKVFSER